MNSILSRAMEIVYDYNKSSDYFIYQMGKVGSTALEKSLSRSKHFHSLYGSGPCYVYVEQTRKGVLKKLRRTFGDALKRFAIKRKEKIKIITIVREPIGRSFSMFFQDLPYWLYSYIGRYGVDTRDEGLDILVDAYWKAFDHKYYDSWFDCELKRFTGIDVFEYPFNFDLGFVTIKNQKFEVFVTRSEDLGKFSVIEGLKEFCDTDISINPTNIGEKKWYSSVYKKFRSEIEINETQFKRFFDCKTSKHFYNKEEIEEFKKKYVNAVA